MDRNQLLWALVIFFGASILFRAIQNGVKDQGTGVSLALQGVAALVLVGAIVFYARRKR